MNFKNAMEARSLWAKDLQTLADAGVHFDGVQSYRMGEWAHDIRRVPPKMFGMAGDAFPTQSSANSGIPYFLTTTVDPEVLNVLFSPVGIGDIIGEGKRGDWTSRTAMFPTVEHSGEVTSYGDNNENGQSGANPFFPQRESYLFQTIKRYGELELARAELAKINYANELDVAVATIMAQFRNYTYAVGVAGLQNYGILNDPALTAVITPGTKAAGNGNVWMFGNVINGTPNEIYADIEALFAALVSQTGGIVEMKDEMTLALSPTSSVALTATNSFNVNVAKLLKDNFPNLEIKTEVRYGALSAVNPQGIAAGATAQLIANKLQGKAVGFAAYNEKMRTGPVIQGLSNYAQKCTGGTWGTVIRQPAGVATMRAI
jgi:hypothetical protein